MQLHPSIAKVHKMVLLTAFSDYWVDQSKGEVALTSRFDQVTWTKILHSNCSPNALLSTNQQFW